MYSNMSRGNLYANPDTYSLIHATRFTPNQALAIHHFLSREIPGLKIYPKKYTIE
jgi:hypothetical protein